MLYVLLIRPKEFPLQFLDPTSSPAFGKRETDLPFYKNVSLVIPLVVSALVFIIVLFMVVICLRKHSDEPGDRMGKVIIL